MPLFAERPRLLAHEECATRIAANPGMSVTANTQRNGKSEFSGKCGAINFNSANPTAARRPPPPCRRLDVSRTPCPVTLGDGLSQNRISQRTANAFANRANLGGEQPSGQTGRAAPTVRVARPPLSAYPATTNGLAGRADRQASPCRAWRRWKASERCLRSPRRRSLANSTLLRRGREDGRRHFVSDVGEKTRHAVANDGAIEPRGHCDQCSRHAPRDDSVKQSSDARSSFSCGRGSLAKRIARSAMAAPPTRSTAA